MPRLIKDIGNHDVVVRKDFKDITDQRFGDLTAIGFSHFGDSPHGAHWLFRCERCGLSCIKWAGHVTSGDTTTCGCLADDLGMGIQPGDPERIARQREAKVDRESNRMLSFDGETLRLAEMARKHGLKPGTLSSRLHKLGWSLEKALTTPIQPHRMPSVKDLK